MDEEGWYGILQLVFSLLSICGCSLAMASVLIMWRSSQILMKMILFLALTQFCVSTIGFLASPAIGVNFTKNDKVCIAQAAIFLFFQKSGWMWITSLSICMVIIVRGTAEAALNKYFIFIHFICWITCAIFALSMIPHLEPIVKFNGEMDSWCAVNDSWIIVSYFAPLLVLFTINFGCIVYIVIKLTKNFEAAQEVYTQLISTRSKTNLRVFILRLVGIPIIFIFCYIGSIACRALILAGHKMHFTWFFAAETFWLEGFLFSIVYLGKRTFFQRLSRQCGFISKDSYSFS